MEKRKWNIGWGPVSLCNMNCAFCYSKTKREESHDLNFNDWKKFIDENASFINSINFGTGENTLKREWFDLIKYIRTNYPEIPMSLTTNGHLSEVIKKDSELYKIFVDSIDEVDVSLDFADKEAHNKFRGQPKAYDWALETLKICKGEGKRTTIVFLGSEENISNRQIDTLFEIGAKYNTILRMNIYRPTDGINEFTSRFILKYQTIVDVLKHISSNHKIIALNDTLFSTIFTTDTIADPSGDLSIRILSDGSITPSTYLIKKEHVVGNITEPHVLKALEWRLKSTPALKRHIPDECKGCFYEQRCAGGVYDRRKLWYGDLNRKDPYCPMKFSEPWKEKIKVTKEIFESVHDGYLPTIFFKP